MKIALMPSARRGNVPRRLLVGASILILPLLIMISSLVVLFHAHTHLIPSSSKHEVARLWEQQQQDGHRYHHSHGQQRIPLDLNDAVRAYDEGHVHPFFEKRDTVFYSVRRPDRSGCVALMMLKAHAYAFLHNATYKGACSSISTLVETLNLFNGMSLNELLPLVECPQFDEHGFADTSNVTTRRIPPRKYSRKDDGDTSVFTVEYLRALGSYLVLSDEFRRQRQLLSEEESLKDGRPIIVVHIRREDVDPCTRWAMRYFPNSYFLTLIDRYVSRLQDERPGVEPRVIVFSQTPSRESFDVFHRRGYDVRLDSKLDDVWRRIAFGSDVVILSWSTFSLFPSVLRTALRVASDGRDKGGIVVSPFIDNVALPGWHLVEKELEERARSEMMEMRKSCPAEMLEKSSRLVTRNVPLPVERKHSDTSDDDDDDDDKKAPPRHGNNDLQPESGNSK